MKQTLKYIYSILTENLKFAESKHSILIALNSALAVFICGYLVDTSILIKFLTCIDILLIVFSLFFNFIALLSRKIKYVKNLKFKEKELNLIYYKHIINFSYDEYLEMIKKDYNFPKDYKFDGLDEDLSKQIIAISNVTNIKFSYFNYSLIFLFLELILTILIICLVGLGF
ncbi:MAG: hypothetical protein E7359_03895 [Clostridiales bacterium]|nr:hypothetical protein [Clostridiales bacterium]